MSKYESNRLPDESPAEYAARIADEQTQPVAPGRMNRWPVYSAIEKEREAQDAKWGGPEQDDKHGLVTWNSLVRLHNGGAVERLREGSPATWRKEMVQVAALAVAAVEAYDRHAAKHPL